MYFYFMLLLIPCFILSAWASSKVNTTFRKYQKIANRSGMTGYDTAYRLMSRNGVNSISIGRVGGTLSDHYDPTRQIVNLSESVYGYASIGSVAVAAHEIGHVMQKETGYLPYKFRNILVPITNFGSRFALPLVLIGLLLDFFGSYTTASYLIYIGIALYGLSTLFMLATLPVEFDASARALDMLVSENILSEDEIGGAKKVLSAAAMTYVASLLTSLVYFLRFLMIVLSISGRRKR